MNNCSEAIRHIKLALPIYEHLGFKDKVKMIKEIIISLKDKIISNNLKFQFFEMMRVSARIAQMVTECSIHLAPEVVSFLEQA